MLASHGSVASQGGVVLYKKYNSVQQKPYLGALDHFLYYPSYEGVATSWVRSITRINSTTVDVHIEVYNRYNKTNRITTSDNTGHTLSGVISTQVIGNSLYYSFVLYGTPYWARGSYISDVEAPLGTYPANGRHSDGYWYVLQ